MNCLKISSSQDSFRVKNVCFLEGSSGNFLGGLLEQGKKAVGAIADKVNGGEIKKTVDAAVGAAKDIPAQVAKELPVQEAAKALDALKLEASGINPAKILDAMKKLGINPGDLATMTTDLPDILSGVRTAPISDIGLAVGMIRVLDALMPNRIDHVLALVMKYVPPEMAKDVMLAVIPMIPENLLRDAIKEAVANMSKDELIELAKGSVRVEIPLLGVDIAPIGLDIASSVLGEDAIKKLVLSQVEGMSDDDLRKKVTEGVDKMTPDQLRSAAIHGGNGVYMSLRKKLIPLEGKAV